MASESARTLSEGQLGIFDSRAYREEPDRRAPRLRGVMLARPDCLLVPAFRILIPETI